MFTPPVADLPWLAYGLTIASSIALVAGLLWLTRRPAPPAGERFDLEYALAVATMLVVVPPSPRYAFTWLLLGFIIVAARLARSGAPWLLMALFALSYVLAARLVYFPVPFLRRLVMDGQFMLSALLFWGVAAWMLRQHAPVVKEVD
jgi:hypothetical protein